MAQAQQMKEFSFPAGGIADFYMEDAQIEALEKQEALEAFGDSGIARFDDVAKRMASYGRHGDDTVAHVETGELVVPKALIENNPKLRESIFDHLREMGIEEPERYVVGSGANSLNPETGLPEFFFNKIKKAISKVTKGVSKAVKKVAKVVKKVAPVILPVALAMTPLGPVYGAALGSGIGTLAAGGSIEDAFKNAVIAGGTGALFRGFQGPGSFGENVSGAFADPAGRFSQTLTGAQNTLSGQGFRGEGNLFGGYQTPTVETVSSGNQPQMSQSNYNPETGKFDLGNTPVTTEQVTDKSFLDSAKEFIMPSGPSPEQLTQIEIDAYNNAIAGGATPELAKNAAARAVANAIPGFLEKFGPSLLLAGGAAAAGGFFDTPEPEENPLLADLGPSAEERIAQNPEQFLIDTDPRYAMGPFELPTAYPFRGSFPQMVAEGGEIFPRRIGGIMPDEGIPNEDSVRAMLMPGEFVMTTDAVKGLGNGDNEQGIRKMYDMMRGLEAKGRAMA